MLHKHSVQFEYLFESTTQLENSLQKERKKKKKQTKERRDTFSIVFVMLDRNPVLSGGSEPLTQSISQDIRERRIEKEQERGEGDGERERERE